MDRIASIGSDWTCGTLQTAGLYSLEAQACGSNIGRFVTGLLSVAAVTLLVVVVATYLFIGRAR